MHDLHQYLPQLYIFRLVAEHGSFQAVASLLAMPRSSVSKKVMQLEQVLDQRLLQRSTRQLRLTDEGEALLKATHELGEIVTKTATLKMAQQSAPVGRVKISTSTLIGHRYIVPLVLQLRNRLPNITIELNVTDEVVDLIANRVDIAVRVGNLPDSSLVAKKIGQKSWACFASPSYLAQQTKPEHPSELAQRTCLIFKNSQFTMDHWTFSHSNGETVNIPITNRLCADDGRTLLELATLGAGIVFVDPLLIQPELKSGALVPILKDWRYPTASPIHLVCLGRQARNRAVDAVWQFLTRELNDLNAKAISPT